MKVVVADDQTAVREGLVTLLETMPGVEVTGAAADGEEAIAIVAGTSPDVVLMDLRMPGVDGVEATRRIHADHPATRVVVLTTYADDESPGSATSRSHRLSNQGRRSRPDPPSYQAAAAGQAILDPEVAAPLVQTAALPSRSGAGPLPDGLTEREAEVLRLIATGLSNSQIAQQLYLSEATVKTHINHIFTKTSSRDRPHAVAYAHRRVLQPETPPRYAIIRV